MIRISQIKLSIDHADDALFQQIIRVLNVKKDAVLSWNIEKQSIDARKKPEIFYIYSVNVSVENETKVYRKLKKHKQLNIQLYESHSYDFQGNGSEELIYAPIIIGMGPAGMFCGLQLAEAGYCPRIFERGACVEERMADVEKFWNTGVLDTESNVQFGEGGAGTFSDGKLNTGVKDPKGRNRKVLETFVQYGAPEEILYESKPHIGTDILIHVVRNIRNRIIELGGSISFHSKVTELLIQDQEIKGVMINGEETVKSNVVVVAIGHSARDTFQYMHDIKIAMEPKSFAIGLRVEHSQKLINLSQYGMGYSEKLPAAPYKLTANLPSGRGVYSFCMCPGGYVVNASSQEGMLCVNGMSYSKRDSENANSAIVVTVNPVDYQNENRDEVLSGMYYQQELERKAYELGQGYIPVQLYGDYCANIPSKDLKEVLPQMKGKYFATNIRQILPSFIGYAIEEGMEVFGHKIKGFNQESTILSAIESRTSSPVRITRNQDFEGSVMGLYPCGEGAGYAGGITSAAIDGIKVYEAICNRYKVTK